MTPSNKNIVPIAFAFDENLIVPAEVCISSLLANAKPDTYYDIFILHADSTDLSTFEAEKLKSVYGNCNITLRNVGNAFESAFEIRGITIPAYYRLLIPELINEHDKIVYSDVDVAFRSDLWELFSTNIGNAYIGATYDWGMMLDTNGRNYANATDGLNPDDYIQSGFLLMNSKKLREDGMVARFKEAAKKNYKYQDQDILNLTCGKNKVVLPMYYNMTDYSFRFLLTEPEKLRQWCSDEEIARAHNAAMLHFNGHKPWKKYSVNFDIWWEAYRKSPVFDEKYYFDFFYSRLNELDMLPLWKRVKILLRYFVYGRRN